MSNTLSILGWGVIALIGLYIAARLVSRAVCRTLDERKKEKKNG